MNAFEAMAALNARHPWSHNDHFHGWILRNLPAASESALDVGCGRGDLVALLSRRFRRITGVDVDAEMARVSAERFASSSAVEVVHQSFLDVTGEYDVITMVASLHHLDHAAALAHAKQLLRPGGRLLVVGLAARSTSAVDLGWDLASAVLNPLVGMVKHPRAVRSPQGHPFPVAEPIDTFAQLATSIAQVLPGAELRRRLFFRFTLMWTHD